MVQPLRMGIGMTNSPKENRSNELEQIKNNLSPEINNKLMFLKWLTDRLAERHILGCPILVGESAVQVYTFGNYGSVDLDILTHDIDATVDILRNTGFKLFGRQWYSSELDITVDIVSGEFPEKLQKLNYRGTDILLSSVEDMIIDRLTAAVYWGARQNIQAKDDFRWAELMLALSISSESAYSDDIEYLKKRAAEEDVSPWLELMLEKRRQKQAAEKRDDDVEFHER